MFCNSELSSVPNLNQLSIHHINIDSLQCLLQLKQRLKSLEIYEFVDMKPAHFPILEKLLRKLAPTLERLLLVIRQIYVPVEDMETNHIQVPQFPKLVALNIGWDVGLNTYYDKTNTKTTLLFPSGEIDYEQDFPELQSLTLWPFGFGKYPNFRDYSYHIDKSDVTKFQEKIVSFYTIWFPCINPIFGGRTKIVQSVQVLDVLTQLWVYGEIRSLFSQRAVSRIRRMFPNLRDKTWAEKALKEKRKNECNK